MDRKIPVVSDLESDPSAFVDFAKNHFGVDCEFMEIFGFEEDLLGMIPQPVLGVTLLLDYNAPALEAARKKERSTLVVPKESPIFFCNQLLSKSCASLTILHIVANNLEALPPTAGLKKMIEDNRAKTAPEKGLAFVETSGNAKDISMATKHSKCLDFDAPGDDSHEPHPHFICFIESNGSLYELDGAKPAPINHGPTNGDLLLTATRVIQSKFFALAPDSVVFNMMAVVKAYQI